jgi:hypothetical protein
VLESLGADLALCVEPTDNNDEFKKHAKYVWEYPNYNDWTDAYNDVQKEIGITKNWRSILDVGDGLGFDKGCLFGGIKHTGIYGSGALLFYYRWRALENIRRLNLTSMYDWFIITRSDFKYDVPHVPLSLLDDNCVWSPNGERYGGITDRHLICPSKFIERSIDMLGYMVSTPNELIEKYRNYMRSTPAFSHPNPESFIAFYLQKQGIPVKFVPYFMYVVRDSDEKINPTSPGNLIGRITSPNNRSYGIKYHTEKTEVDKLSISVPEDWAKYINMNQ